MPSARPHRRLRPRRRPGALTALSAAVAAMAAASFHPAASAFQTRPFLPKSATMRRRTSTRAAASDDPDGGGGGGDAVVVDAVTGRRHRLNADGSRKCAYLFDGQWRQRVRLDELEVGRKLEGRKVDGCDLLDGRTGPKIFFECGVGRTDPAGRWHIVNGMLRLGRRGAKKSATRKRAQRLTDKAVDLYVSAVRPECGTFEVSTSLEQVRESAEARKGDAGKAPLSSLEEGRELVGTVARVEPYGAIVDVGAGRNGLLHIRRVRRLFQRYIDKEEGLIEAGLERGAQIRVAVLSNEKKRLFLDFTEDVREGAKAERRAKRAEARKRREERLAGKQGATVPATEKGGNGSKGGVVASISDDGGYEVPDAYAEEAAAWAAYGAGDDGGGGGMSQDEAAEWAAFAAEEDYHDEDDDIEDALGISTY